MSATHVTQQVVDGSGCRITAVRTHCLKLPYKKPVAFKSVTQSSAEYIVLRLVSDSGEEGVAEAVCRPEFSGEDARSLSYVLGTLFGPLLAGADPLQHMATLAKLDRFKGCRAAKALIDIALWDLRGKILKQPVWKLLGGGPIRPVPLTWVAHGNTSKAMAEEACRMVQEHGYRGVKLKAWKRSVEDIQTAEAVRTKVGDKTVIYVDGNSTYTETEARTILGRLSDYGISFIEDPTLCPSMQRMASLAQQLPIAILGDEFCDSLTSVYRHIEASAVGAVSVKLRRTGFTESLKIIALCEGSGIPAIIGTDSESPIGALARAHMRMAVPHLSPWPIETHFFEKLAADVFKGDFIMSDGQITVTDAPGFGADVDEARLAEFSF